ncbi:hypothetical protein GCM10023257_05160 [Streptomyces hyderabadensis]|uniref:Uncharacterized protein n=1 Tax=Streptomyces hyderabadensis TaxID=598549 RepID=A0ABP9HJ23_9ACTN
MAGGTEGLRIGALTGEGERGPGSAGTGSYGRRPVGPGPGGTEVRRDGGPGWAVVRWDRGPVGPRVCGSGPSRGQGETGPGFCRGRFLRTEPRWGRGPMEMEARRIEARRDRGATGM